MGKERVLMGRLGQVVFTALLLVTVVQSSVLSLDAEQWEQDLLLGCEEDELRMPDGRCVDECPVDYEQSGSDCGYRCDQTATKKFWSGSPADGKCYRCDQETDFKYWDGDGCVSGCPSGKTADDYSDCKEDVDLRESQYSLKMVNIDGNLTAGNLSVTLMLPENQTLSLKINETHIVANNHTDGVISVYNTSSEPDPVLGEDPKGLSEEKQTESLERAELQTRDKLEAKTAVATVDMTDALTDAAKAKVNNEAVQKEAKEALTAQQYADAKVLTANADLKQLKKELKKVTSKLKGVHALRATEQAQEDDKQTKIAVQNAAAEGRAMRRKAKKEAFREDARAKKEIQAIQKASVKQARKLIEVAAVKASGISNSTQVKIQAAEEQSAAAEVAMRQHAELAAQGFKTESDNRIAKAKRDAAEAERQERVRAAARMEAIRQEANKEEAAKIVNKANGKANGDAMRSGGSSTHDLSALEDMTDLDIEALAKSANATPEPPRVSEEEAKKQVRADFALDDVKRASQTREARDMIAKERADARESAEHAARVHRIADDTIEQKEHEKAAGKNEEDLEKIENGKGFTLP